MAKTSLGSNGRSPERGPTPDRQNLRCRARRRAACRLTPRPPFIAIEGLSKSFSGIRVLKDVSFDVRPGEVHALLGENGAGKSTLIKTIAGVHKPDSGRIVVDGRAHNAHGAA